VLRGRETETDRRSGADRSTWWRDGLHHWVEGSEELSEGEAQRLLGMMNFPNVEDIAGYTRLLKESGCEVHAAEDTGRFPSYVDLYLNMIEMQLTYDVLRTVAFRSELLLKRLVAELSMEKQILKDVAERNF
jgi:hypothetical protein